MRAGEGGMVHAGFIRNSGGSPHSTGGAASAMVAGHPAGVATPLGLGSSLLDPGTGPRDPTPGLHWGAEQNTDGTEARNMPTAVSVPMIAPRRPLGAMHAETLEGLPELSLSARNARTRGGGMVTPDAAWWDAQQGQVGHAPMATGPSLSEGVLRLRQERNAIEYGREAPDSPDNFMEHRPKRRRVGILRRTEVQHCPDAPLQQMYTQIGPYMPLHTCPQPLSQMYTRLPGHTLHTTTTLHPVHDHVRAVCCTLCALC